MRIQIKLFGGLSSEIHGRTSYMKRSFILELNAGATLDEIHKALALSSENNLISIVDGHAQTKDYVIEKECTISIFPPMSTR